MKNAPKLLAAALLALSSFAADRLPPRLARLIARDPAARGAEIGILVTDLKGRVIASLNADRLFTPASNTKLFSMALALERLGPDKRFETRVERRGDDLVIVGAGDANLSGRPIPYIPDAPHWPALVATDDLAAQIAATGIHDIAGSVVGDDTAFPDEPYAEGWAAEDIVSGDGAPVSALAVDDNEVHLRVSPGPADGAPATVALDPPLDLFSISAAVATSSAKEKIETDRIPGTREWRVWGTLPATAGTYSEALAVDDPALFAAQALTFSLVKRGIAVHGPPKFIHRFRGIPFASIAGGEVVARHTSPPLLEDIRLIGKVSQNLHADLLLFDVGGSREDGLVELSRFLNESGVPPGQYRFYDGSGLSRLNLVSPRAVAALLLHESQSLHFEQFLSALPVSGTDGTLEHRLVKKSLQGRIYAKTGTLMHTSALSGFADTPAKRRLIFSIFINNSLAGVDAREELIDKLCSGLIGR